MAIPDGEVEELREEAARTMPRATASRFLSMIDDYRHLRATEDTRVLRLAARRDTDGADWMDRASEALGRIFCELGSMEYLGGAATDEHTALVCGCPEGGAPLLVSVSHDPAQSTLIIRALARPKAQETIAGSLYRAAELLIRERIERAAEEKEREWRGER